MRAGRLTQWKPPHHLRKHHKNPEMTLRGTRLVQLRAGEPVRPGDAGGRRAAQAGGAVHVHAPAAAQSPLDRPHDPRQAAPQALPVKVHDLQGEEKPLKPSNPETLETLRTLENYEILRVCW